MKHSKPILLILVICAAAFLLLRRGSSLPDASGASSASLDVPAVQISGERQQPDPSVAEGKPAENSSVRSIKLGDVPESAFRSELERLPPDIQATVLERIRKEPQLLNDIDSIHLDADGMIFYVCKIVPETSAADAEIATAAAGSFIEYPVFTGPVLNSSPPAFHSRPGATKVLFLDFNGHDITGTKWNLNPDYAMPTTWYCLPYDKDGDPSQFSVSEQQTIYEVWSRVSEDYAPFDVDVTTEQPTKWTSTTGHALITPDHDAYGQACPHDGAGGVGYVDVFGLSNYSYNYKQPGGCYSPVWVQDYSAANAAEVISHELGHNMGLYHDGLTDAYGTTIDSYYDGHENGSISWGAIMGASYGKNVTQWSKGDYYRANNTEDDLAKIAAKLSYIPDDYGDSSGAAFVLNFNGGNSLSVTGRVETTDDPDVFSVTFPQTSVLTISAQVAKQASASWGANLDVLLEVRDSSENLIISTNGALELPAQTQVELPSGTYYLYVQPTGVGNPLASTPTGYTSYGSLGRYVLSLSAVPAEDTDSDGLPNAWELQYFGNETNALAGADNDSDGFDNLEEYISGSNPTSAASFFRVINGGIAPAGIVIRWNSVTGRVYSVNRTTNLLNSFQSLETNIVWPRASYTDTVHSTESKGFYKIDVRLAP